MRWPRHLPSRRSTRAVPPTVVALRGERNPLRVFTKILGPGLVTGASDDDPSGIGTYAQAGAAYGYATLWTTVAMLPMMISVQYICAKIGLVNGRGLAGVLREHYPRWVLYPAVLALVVANTINAGVDIGAIAASSSRSWARTTFVPDVTSRHDAVAGARHSHLSKRPDAKGSPAAGGRPSLENVKLRLGAWRDAERRRDVLAVGTPEWRDAEEEARTAAKLFHAEVAQVSARYEVEDFNRRKPWTAQVEQRTAAEGNSVGDAPLDGWPQE